MVPWVGLEPTIPFGNAILSRARIPFRHHGTGAECMSNSSLRHVALYHDTSFLHCCLIRTVARIASMSARYSVSSPMSSPLSFSPIQ